MLTVNRSLNAVTSFKNRLNHMNLNKKLLRLLASHLF
jgi:hypothetical protein